MTITPDPSDNTTLSAVLADYASGGYEGEFTVSDEGVRCVSCGGSSAAGSFEIQSLRRLEGASDPSDMVAVLASACPLCSTRGTMVVMFGPEATAAEAELLRRSQDRRLDDDDLPAGAAPTEGGTTAEPEA